MEPEVRLISRGEYEHTFRLGSASCSWLSGGQVVDRIRYDFARAELFFRWLWSVQQKDRTTWVFAHGLGYALTLMDFWRRLGTRDERYLWAVLEDPPTIICCRRGRRLLKYVDVQNYWRVPFSELAGTDKNSGSVVTATHAPDSYTIDHARFKVRVLEDLICKAINLVAKSEMCSWQCTAAALAWSAYRHSFMQQPIYIHAHAAASKLERASLFGGRLTLLRSGWVNEPTFGLDVHSLYPSIMARESLPYKLVNYQDEASVHELRQALQGFFCVAEVSIRAPHPPLPHRRDGLVSYSDESAVCVLCGPDVAHAVGSGMVQGCGRLARYERSPLFCAFVNHFYRAKVEAEAEGKMTDRLLYKMVLNGLSGKFAQRKRGWTDDKEALCPDAWAYWWQIPSGGGRPIRYRSIGGRAQRLQEGGETRNSFPAITSAITSFGRHELQRLVEVAGGGNTFYTDTDCLHVNQAGYSALAMFGEICPGQLGRLREVARGADAYYWGPKHYRVGHYWVSNVIQMTAKNVSEGTWLQESRRGLEMTFARGILDRVIVRDIEVKVGTGAGAYRP